MTDEEILCKYNILLRQFHDRSLLLNATFLKQFAPIYILCCGLNVQRNSWINLGFAKIMA